MLGLPGLIGKLVEDARHVARAEIRLVKARGLDLFRRSRTAIALLLVALVAAQGALIALMVGMVLQLAAMVGGAIAGLIVMAVMLLIAVLIAWGAYQAFTGSHDRHADIDVAETVA